MENRGKKYTELQKLMSKEVGAIMKENRLELESLSSRKVYDVLGGIMEGTESRSLELNGIYILM